MARYYPDSFIEEVRERADLLEVVGRHVQLKKRGTNWVGLCPFHSEKTPSFSVRPDQGFYKCFGCGVGGDIFNFLMKIKGVGFSDVVEEVATSVGLPLPVSHHEGPLYRQQREERQQLLEMVDKARHWFHQKLHAAEGRPAREYLQRRGLKADTVRLFGLGYAPPGWHNILNHFGGGKNAEILLEKSGLAIVKEKGHSGYDRFRDRIIFPIQDYQGRCIGFGGRLLAQGTPKYINSPETLLYQKGEVLYGMDQAQKAIQREGRVVVVEGYMDLIALANHGIDDVVATLGTALTPSHLRQLWKRTRRICFCFDGDLAGKKAAWRALKQVLSGLEADRHASFLFLPDGTDPDDMVRHEGAQGFRKRVEGATSLTEFLTRQLSQGLNTKSPEGRAAVAYRARPLLAKVADPLLRELYGESLGQYLGVTWSQVMGVPQSPPSRKPPPLQAGLRSYADPPLHASGPPLHFDKPLHAGSTARRRQHKQHKVTTTGRDFEQALLAILMRAPDLVVTHEEELGQLELENPQLSRLLSELIHLGTAQSQKPEEDGQADREIHEWHSNGKSWLWKQLPTTEMLSWAEKILIAEEVEPESLQEEFCGCLLNCQLRHLQRQIDKITQEIDTESGNNARQFGMLQALMQEQKRLLLRKCHPVSATMVESKPA